MYQRSVQSYGTPTASTGSMLGQVLGYTGIGFLVTAVATYLTGSLALPQGISLGAMLVGFVLLFAISGTRANPGLSLGLFYLFTFCEGIGIGPVVTAYARLDGPAVVLEAAATTGLGMLVLAGVVSLTSFDYRKLSGYAFAGLILLVIVSLISAFTHFLHPATISWLTLVVFTALVLVDFARLKAGGGGLTPVQMAVSIYLDAINIFLAILRLTGSRRDD
jgi:modulator of FtsH protease